MLWTLPAGFYIIPRSPTEVYYDVSTEAVEAQLYNWFYCCNTTSNSACPASAAPLATRPSLMQHGPAPAAGHSAPPRLRLPVPPTAVEPAPTADHHLFASRWLRGGQAIHQAVKVGRHPGPRADSGDAAHAGAAPRRPHVPPGDQAQGPQ